MNSLSTKTKLFNFFRRIFLFGSFEKILRMILVNRQIKIFEKLVPMNYLYRSPARRTFSIRGINYELDISSFNSWGIYWDITNQIAPKNDYYKLLGSNDIIIDIGAHVGETVLNAAKIITNGHVYGFEAHPVTFQLLSNNISLNSFKNVSVYNFGMGDEIYETEIGSPTDYNEGKNSIVAESNTNTLRRKVRTNIITLDSFVNEYDIKMIDVIKIDVEGFEKKVILGGRKTLKMFKPILFIELSDNPLKRQGSSAREFYYTLIEHGYHDISDARNGIPLNETYPFENCHTDIVARAHK